MELVLIRHGDPDYSTCTYGGINGQGYGLVPLSQKGMQQAQQVANDPTLQGAQLIVSSPYTRALQTAAEIVRTTGLPLMVEPDLHEMMSDRTGTPHSLAELKILHNDFLSCRGCWPDGEERPWETVNQLTDRVSRALSRYLDYDKIIVVTHGGVIRRFWTGNIIEYCVPYVVHMENYIKCHGWIEISKENT